MRTRELNIYPIGWSQGVACVLAALCLLAVGVAPAWGQCEDLGGAGDQYCEGLPGAGGQQGVRKLQANPGVPASTGRALEEAGAGGVRLVESPRRNPRRSAGGAASAPAPTLEGPNDESALPYFVAGLTLAVLATILLLRRRRGAATGEEAAP